MVNSGPIDGLTPSEAIPAAIEWLAAQPWCDGNIGMWGSSYGGFMTANLLAHSDLFRAGIARSGAYNRSMTPFVFQREQRTIWEDGELYARMWNDHQVTMVHVRVAAGRDPLHGHRQPLVLEEAPGGRHPEGIGARERRGDDQHAPVLVSRRGGAGPHADGDGDGRNRDDGEALAPVPRPDHGSAVITRNRLTLAVQPGYYLSSMRRELPLSDFYAEITARPSLCRGEDNYGLIIRGVGSSFYRFLLNCSGMVWAERITGGTKLRIHEPVPSGDAPPGAPGEVRIGMWAVGSEMRLFLNDRFQFSVTEPTFPIGAIGVFVRSNGETPATILFSDLEVYDVDYTPPTKTPFAPTPTP